MKSRRYLNVGPGHDPKPGEFFDQNTHDYYTEVDQEKSIGEPNFSDKIIPFPEEDHPESL